MVVSDIEFHLSPPAFRGSEFQSSKRKNLHPSNLKLHTVITVSHFPYRGFRTSLHLVIVIIIKEIQIQRRNMYF
jgi:hypothetical protein